MSSMVRLATSADAAQIAAIYAPFCETTIVSFEEIAPDAAEMAKRIERINQRWPWLVLDDRSTIVGYAYGSQHRERAAYRWSVDVTVYVADGARRQGVGRRLYEVLFRLLALQGYFQAFAGIALPNPASEGLHLALGFEPVGTYRLVGYKLGAWHDVRWFQRALQPERADPPAPRPLAEVAGTAEWDQAINKRKP